MSQPTKEKLDDASKPLKLNKLYEEFFSKDTTSNFDGYCNDLKKYDGTHKGAKELCIKLVRFVKKIAEWKNKPESVKYCDYLQYWLYDEIKEIYKEHTKKFGEIPFSKELIEIANKVNKEVKPNDCTLKHEKDVTLDELVKRKYAYIYYKKQTDIKNTINSQSTYDCNKYFTYLTNIKLLYDKLKNDHCKPSFWLLPFHSDYFICGKTSDPKDLLSTTEKCKAKGSTSGGGTFWGILFGGSSSGTGANRNGTLTQAPTRTAGLETKMPGSGKNLSPDVSPKDKAVKGTTESTVAGDKSKVLSSSTRSSGPGSLTSSPSTGSSARPEAGAPSSVQKATLNPKSSISTQSSGIPALGVLPVSPNTLDIRRDAVPVPIVDSPTTSEGVSDKVDSNFYRNIIMAAAILGTIFFLFYYNMSSGLKSRFPKRKRKKKIFEHNYYEEYEKELAKYDSENESLDSQSDQYYLNYQPEGDYDY
ncbi:VIR protein [Plasmodium vivax]|uniref:VIR protein n=1 Tax=Plasmodium vivax TaxID=5855 RepID=A0A1G4E7S0_PLAVI|nr:VIR protein [Plasmodium vivax]